MPSRFATKCMAKGMGGEVLERCERKLACEIESLLRAEPAPVLGSIARDQAAHESRIAACARALAPHSPNLRGVLADAARALIKRGLFDRELYGASLRALADAKDKRLAAILKTALASDEAGNLPALSVACFVDDDGIGALLGRAASAPNTQISFGAEVARMMRGELSGARLTSLAPKIKESYRISLCMELLLPLAQRFAVPAEKKAAAGALNGGHRGGAADCAPVAEALRVLQSAERHLGRWLVMGEIAHRAGDRRSLDEALEKSVSGPQSSRGAWSFVGWALDPTLGKPSVRPTSEIVARLSHRPSADRDPGFLFRLGEASVEAALPMLEAYAKPRPLEDEVAVRAAYVLARCYGQDDLKETIGIAAERGQREEVRGVAAAALWDLGERDRAKAAANALAGSESLAALMWSSLVSASAKRANGSNGNGHATPLILDGQTFRRVHWGWPE